MKWRIGSQRDTIGFQAANACVVPAMLWDGSIAFWGVSGRWEAETYGFKSVSIWVILRTQKKCNT